MIKKLITSIALAGALLVPTLTMNAPDAQAAGCGAMNLCDETGSPSAPSKPSPGGNPPSKPKPSKPPTSDYYDGSNWKFVYSKLYVPDKCSVRGDGAKPVVLKIAYREIYKNTAEKTPPSTHAWKYEGFFPMSGAKPHSWSRYAHQSSTCLYGSAFVTKTVTCNISNSVSLNKIRPNAKTLKAVTKKTGFKEGSKNYNSCLSSVGGVSVSVPVTEYGTYSTSTWKRAQTMTVKLPVTANQYTGTFDKMEVVNVSPAFNTAPRKGMTGSLDCKNGWKSPAIAQPKYWTDEGCEGNYATSYRCDAPGVKVDVSNTGKARSMKTMNSGILELLNDGKPRLIDFNQKISGANIKINSTSSRFTRSGSPWDSSLSLNKNLLEISNTAKGNSIWKDSGSTAWVSGNRGDIYLSSIQASNPGSHTKLTHELKWTGTKKQSSVKIVEINADTGSVITQGTTVTVPTSGSCSQSVNLKYLRVVGGM